MASAFHYKQSYTDRFQGFKGLEDPLILIQLADCVPIRKKDKHKPGKSSEDSVLVACDQGNYHCAGDLRLNSLLHIAKCPILSAESWHVLLGKS